MNLFIIKKRKDLMFFNDLFPSLTIWTIQNLLTLTFLEIVFINPIK
jgi:hypothetical protein